MKVEEIMSINPETIDFKAPIREAMDKMRDRKCRHLPVTNESGVAGMVSDRELRGFILSYLKADKETVNARIEDPISRLTQGDLISIGPDDDIKEAISLMLENDVGALPVIDPAEGTLIGMLSYVDILHTVYETLPQLEA